jgi:lipid-binding SYLF domain-containing protein
MINLQGVSRRKSLAGVNIMTNSQSRENSMVVDTTKVVADCDESNFAFYFENSTPMAILDQSAPNPKASARLTRLESEHIKCGEHT